MNIQVAAVCSAAEQQEDVRGQVKALASRKILRFLDAVSYGPFAAIATAYRRNPVCPPEDVALYTVSGWDGDMPDQPFTTDGSRDEYARLSRHILEDANPTGWLRMLSNNALCQVSIVEGFRGPNAHFVGDASALAQALAAAAYDLRTGAAKLALVVAYDVAEADRNNPSDRAPSTAAAISLTATEGGTDVLPGLFTLVDVAADERRTALEALELALPIGVRS